MSQISNLYHLGVGPLLGVEVEEVHVIEELEVVAASHDAEHLVV